VRSLTGLLLVRCSAFDFAIHMEVQEKLLKCEGQCPIAAAVAL
jgi:hypothetical protein